jgi:hypothetical protein
MGGGRVSPKTHKAEFRSLQAVCASATYSTRVKVQGGPLNDKLKLKRVRLEAHLSAPLP